MCEALSLNTFIWYEALLGILPSRAFFIIIMVLILCQRLKYYF